jgi:serine phosphatase RsbU (regulator of sigma subunit)
MQPPDSNQSGPVLGDRDWRGELENFFETFKLIGPESRTVKIGGIEICGDSVFLNGALGGDHLTFLDFDRRYDLNHRIELAELEHRPQVARHLAANRDRIGVLVADVAGHQMTDALVAAMLHQAFLTGVLYELDRFGEVTTRLFENLNTRFFRSLSLRKFVTLTYGEVSRSGAFRFLLAGSPRPLVFSAEFDRIVTIAEDRLVGVFPLGMFPSEDDVDIARNLGALHYKPRYTVNEVNLMGPGDILLLMTDGLSDHERGSESYVPSRLEGVLREVKGESATEIFCAITDSAVSFAPPTDDLSLVVVKRTI